jgi:hypothetical protein
MARSQITVTNISRSGVAPIAQTTADATNKHYLINSDALVFLEIVSTDGSPQTVGIAASPTFTADGLTAGGTVLAGPFKVSTFKQNSSYHLYVNPSVSTTLKFRAWRLPAA